MKIRILLVDDHALFRSGIRSLLEREENFEVVGEAGDGSEGTKCAQQLLPDVVLLDLHMPGLSGLQTLKLIRDSVPSVRVVMLTVSEDTEDLAEAMRNGATGYLLKNAEAASMIDAIRMAVRGETVIPQIMLGGLFGTSVTPQKTAVRKISDHATRSHPVIEKLTPRERQILSGIAQGHSNKFLARELNLSESTVKIHVQSILRKLRLTSRVQAAVYAVEHGLAEETKGASQ